MVVYFKSKTPLIEKFLEDFDHELYEEPSFGQKWGFGSDIKTPDIYFHSGVLKQSDIELMLKSSKVIVSSNTIKANIVDKTNGSITNDMIEVIYPPQDVDKFKKKKFKEGFCDIYDVSKKTKLIYFTGKNYDKTGVITFLKFLRELSSTNFKGVISGSPEQLKSVVPVLKEMDLSDKVILAQGDIFRAADIFLLPTSNKLFASSILRAMACKCVVFTPSTNHIFELLDNFSIMSSPTDVSTVHKIDMLLENSDEIKNIQKQNYQKAKDFTFKKQYKKLKLALNT